MCALLNRCLFSRSLLSDELLSGVLELPRNRAAGHRMGDFFAPQSSIFVSHAWNDGTSKFVRHLKEAIEEHTLLNVWVDELGINQVMTAVCCVARFRLFWVRFFIYKCRLWTMLCGGSKRRCAPRASLSCA